jgi:acyl transferase domain-containing protein
LDKDEDEDGFDTNTMLSPLDELRSLDPSTYFQLEVREDKDYLATSIAHALDLRGPAETVQTACSASLVAIARGAHAIRLGLCDGEEE